MDEIHEEVVQSGEGKIIEPRVVRDNGASRVWRLDGVGPGGARHEYTIGFGGRKAAGGYVKFQEGPIEEVGVNGCQNEDLLAIVIDRLRDFQAGAYSCRENAIALTNIEQALLWLEQRTRKRQARGVEGRNER